MHAPSCPSCGQRAVLVRSFGNLLRTIGAFVVAWFAADLVPLRWRCRACGRRFLAVSDDA
ncbi:MAG: hypothetical protein D6692_06805 [Planctomycetota bacterium]|nr:MAG: hypothetical protein D6692_06805 [Planctomycetota bacterium]